nr:helix-turn-helix transcriptional regulator [Bacillus andreraoultii]
MINKVKENRNKKGLTQKQLAEMVFVSQRTIISLEKGQYKPSIMLAYRLACLFETTIEELFCLAENKDLEDKNFGNL